MIGIEGLGVPDTKTSDVDWSGNNGVYANPDYSQIRVVTIPVIIKGADPLSTLATLETQWAPTDTDTTFQVLLPGTLVTVTGRPRGLKADTSFVNRGFVRALLRFDCPDPTITFA